MKGLARMWRQTVIGTIAGMILLLGVIAYFTLTSTDAEAVETLSWFLMLMPLMLGVSYLIKRLIQRIESP